MAHPRGKPTLQRKRWSPRKHNSRTRNTKRITHTNSSPWGTNIPHGRMIQRELRKSGDDSDDGDDGNDEIREKTKNIPGVARKRSDDSRKDNYEEDDDTYEEEDDSYVQKYDSSSSIPGVGRRDDNVDDDDRYDDADDAEDDNNDDNDADNDDENISNKKPKFRTQNNNAGRRKLKISQAAKTDQRASRVVQLFKKKYFRKVKFLNKERTKVRLMEKMAGDLGVDKTKYKAFAERYIKFVTTTLTSKRGCCGQLMGNVVKEKIDDFQGNVDLLPTVDDLLKLRQGDNQTFFWYAEKLLETVCGINNAWGGEKYSQTSIVDAKDDQGNCFVTVTDEAFVLLLYENYIDKWKEKHRNGWNEKGRNRTMGKYSSSSTGNVGQSGWSLAGLKRFNELVILVEKDRNMPNREERENAFFMYLHNTNKGKREARRRASRKKWNSMDSGDSAEEEEENEDEVMEIYDEL